MDGSVIENCCGAVTLVSHCWIIAKPVKHKKRSRLMQYSMKFKTWVFQSNLCSLSKNLESSPTRTHSQLHRTLPVPPPAPNLPEKPRWDSWVKRSLQPSIPGLAGGQRLGWNGGAGWGKQRHCKSRGGNLVGFGSPAFVDVFCCHCWPDLIQHSSWLCSDCVLEKGCEGERRQNRQVFKSYGKQ